MTRRIMKYNPAFLTPDELVESFVARHAELELITETIRENSGASNQHVLVVGPRGIGKTALLLRVVEETRRDPELQGLWYPIVFGEDSYEVCSPGEFWLEALRRLAEQTGSSGRRRAYVELNTEKDEVRLRERALAQLMDFADDERKRLLLVVENLNMILGDQMQDDDAWILRHTLLNDPRVMMLASAVSRFEEISNAGKAMYDLFRIHELKPLTARDCHALWNAIAGTGLPEKRLRPIEILTGGNPRLITIMANYASKGSVRELILDLTQLVDDHTEYFKGRLDNLAPLERKVFVALADMWDPLSAREVADAARIDVNKTSSILNRLISRGDVVVFEQRGRKKWYQVAERMYNVYHLMRRYSGPSSRIWGVVNFMAGFYEREYPWNTGYLRMAGGISHTPSDFAFPVLEEHQRGIPPRGYTWIENVEQISPGSALEQLRAAYLEGAAGQWNEAIGKASRFLARAENLEDNAERIIEFYIIAAASGHAATALQSLIAAPYASILEPLIVGLRIYMGEEPAVAVEILEVGRDVAKRIESRKERLAGLDV